MPRIGRGCIHHSAKMLRRQGIIATADWILASATRVVFGRPEVTQILTL